MPEIKAFSMFWWFAGCSRYIVFFLPIEKLQYKLALAGTVLLHSSILHEIVEQASF